MFNNNIKKLMNIHKEITTMMIIASTFSILFLVTVSVNLAYAIDSVSKPIQDLLEDVELPKNLTNEQLEQFEDFKSFVDKKTKQGQEERSNINCLSEDTQLGRLGTHLEEEQEKMRKKYKLYGDDALDLLDDLPESLVDMIKRNIETEILIDNLDVTKNIEYKNCSHFESVKLELINVLKQGEQEWDNYWKNTDTEVSKKDLQQIKKYIQSYIK